MNDSLENSKQNPALKVITKKRNHHNTLAIGNVSEYLFICNHRAEILKKKLPLDALNLANFTKWSNTLKQFVGNLPTNCLSVFDHFVGLALRHIRPCQISNIPIRRKMPIFLRTIFTFFLIKLTGNQNTRFCFYKQHFHK